MSKLLQKIHYLKKNSGANNSCQVLLDHKNEYIAQVMTWLYQILCAQEYMRSVGVRCKNLTTQKIFLKNPSDDNRCANDGHCYEDTTTNIIVGYHISPSGDDVERTLLLLGVKSPVNLGAKLKDDE